ncbi:DUF6303 family protein [Streptomyces sp. QTS52]
MTDTTKPVTVRAGLRRVCCEIDTNRLRQNTNRAYWELYLVVYNTTEQWPAHTWPVSRRHQIPTIAERTQALAELGYAPAPDAEWMWVEDETPDNHGHPVAVSVFAGIDIIPLEQAAPTGGESA